MIRLTTINGWKLNIVSHEGILQVTEAGPSQGWHGVRANVQTSDGKWTEVRETVANIEQQIAADRGHL